MNILVRAGGIVVAAGIALAIAWSSTLPVRLSPSSDAVIRISLGARPQRIETCRTVSDSELANVLPQMRQQVVCEGTTARYRLEVRRDDSLIYSRLVRGGGLRHDRQLYVAEDLSVPAGPMSLDVRFVRLDTVSEDRDEDDDDEDERDDSDSAARGQTGDMPTRARRETEERRRRQHEAIPAALQLEADVTLFAREVAIVTYDPDARQLVLRRRPPD